MRRTSRFVALALLSLAAFAATAGPAGACRLHSPPGAEGRWVVDDGQRKIGYRLSGRPHPRFELRIEKPGAFVVCRNCPPGATLGQGGGALGLDFAGAANIDARLYSTPASLRQALEREASSKRMKIRPMSDPKEIALDAFKGWAAPLESGSEAEPGYRWKWAHLYGYLSDGCASIALHASYPDLAHGPTSGPLPAAEEIMRQLADMLQSVAVARSDP